MKNADLQAGDGRRGTEHGQSAERRRPSSVFRLPPGFEAYDARPLEVERDADALQQLYARCLDFVLLSDGAPAAATAGRGEFTAVPDGWALADKFLFGVFRGDSLVGVVEGIRHYPMPGEYWLGLLLLDPAERGHGLGAACYRAFEDWARTEGAQLIGLTVIEDNAPALAFWSKMGFGLVDKTEPKRHGQRVYATYFMTRKLAV